MYLLSSKNINLENGADTAKNLITFAFVPVNSILILPFLANSYRCIKDGIIQEQNFKKRVILLTCILFIALIIEYFYFGNIQEGILNSLQALQTKK